MSKIREQCFHEEERINFNFYIRNRSILVICKLICDQNNYVPHKTSVPSKNIRFLINYYKSHQKETAQKRFSHLESKFDEFPGKVISLIRQGLIAKLQGDNMNISPRRYIDIFAARLIAKGINIGKITLDKDEAKSVGA